MPVETEMTMPEYGAVDRVVETKDAVSLIKRNRA